MHDAPSHAPRTGVPRTKAKGKGKGQQGAAPETAVHHDLKKSQ